MSAIKIAVGDEVRVYGGGRMRGTGKIVKIGRTLVHVDEGRWITLYAKDTQTRRDGRPGYFQTEDQFLDSVAKSDAEQSLRRLGIEIRLGYSSRFSGAQLVRLRQFVEELLKT